MNPFKQSFKQLQQQQQWLAVLIFALVAIVIWVAVSLLSSQKKSGISAELRLLAEPLTPSINREAISALERKRYIYEDSLQDFPIYTIYRDPKTRTEQIILKGQEPILLETQAAAPAEQTPEPAPVPATEPAEGVATNSGTTTAAPTATPSGETTP